MPKISVVMPVYNSEKDLEKTIESLYQQTFKDFELICVNDGSTDHSLDILNNFNKKYNNFIRIFSTENQGAGAARNYGFQFANGETTIFLDSDDYFYPNFLDEMYKKYDETKADIVICQYYHIISENNTSTNLYGVKEKFKAFIPLKKTFNKYDIPNIIFNFCNYSSWNKLYNVEFLRKNNIQFENIPSCNDVFFNLLSLYLADKITTIDIPLLMYKKQNKNSISSKIRKLIDIYKFSTFEKLKKLILTNPENKIFERSLYNEYLSNILKYIDYTNGEMRIKYLQSIKENFKSIPKKEDIYTPLNYYKLYLIKKLPEKIYILLYYKLICNICKIFKIHHTDICNFIFNLFKLPN